MAIKIMKLPFATLWMTLESTMLNEISQAEKAKYSYHLYVEPKK